MQQLIYMYNVEKVALKKIARDYYISYDVLKRLMIHSGLVMRDVKESIRLSNEQMKQMFIDKYGCTFSELGNTPEYREKARETSQKNYGVDNPSSSREVREKVLATVRSKYHVDNVFQDENVKKKICETNKANLGVDYPAQSEKVIQKIMASNLEKFGTSWYMQTNEFKERYIETMQKLYGVDNYFQLDSFRRYLESIHFDIESKRRKTNEDSGVWIKECEKTEFQLYRMKVNNITKKLRSKLFENWDGLCYYTKERLITNEEYVKMNPGKHPNTNRMRPSIDHKISVMYGFLNGIDPQIIGGFDNLCICASYINSVKNKLTNL